MTAMPCSPDPTKSKQARMREKAEEINLVLLEPDVNLWKLRELALSEGGLVNDTIRRRAWPKLVGLTGYQHPAEDDYEEVANPANSNKATNLPKTKRGASTPLKGTAPTRVTNFGVGERPSTAFTGGPFDQHDTAATGTGAGGIATSEDDNSSLASNDSANKKSDITECQDADQIDRDVARCTWHLLTGGQRSRRRIMVNKHRKKVAKVLRRKQRRLGDLINLTIAQSELDLPDDQRLCYYQGYHDVASIFLAALGGASTKTMQQHPPSSGDTSNASVTKQATSMGLDLSMHVLYQISLSHFREPMRNNFLQLQATLRLVLFPLLYMMDPELHAHLHACGMEPFFALSWVITWFSHDIRDTALVKRLFDVFLVSHPLMPIYLSVAMLCHPNNRQEVLATPCEFAELHNTLSGLPKNSSMVGWRWRVGDGYVSDDEEVGEDGETSISLDSDMASHLSNDRSSNRGGQTSLLSGRDGGMGRDNLMLSEGHEHVVSMGIPAHVPFQDVIDLAITFMRRIPPRKLLTIAQRYYSPEQAEPMLKMYPEISFFHPPPSWALARFAKADWVLRKRALDRRGLHSRNSRKDRKVLSDLRNRLNTSTTGEDAAPSKVSFTKSHNEETTFTTLSPMNESDNSNYSPEMMEATARELKWPKAMIAQGFGPGEDEVAKRKRRRRLILIGSAATVALFAIAVGMAMKSQPQSAPQPRLQEASAPPAPKKSTSTTSRSNESHKPFQHKDSSNASSKKGSSIVGSMKTAAKDLFADNSSEGCPADSMPYRAPARENSSVPKAAPVSAVGFPNNNKTAVNESLMRTVIKKMIVNQLKAFVYRIRVLVESIDRNVSDPNFQRRVVDFVKSSSSSLANYTMGLFRSTGQQARDNLGGDSIEDLVLL